MQTEAEVEEVAFSYQMGSMMMIKLHTLFPLSAKRA